MRQLPDRLFAERGDAAKGDRVMAVFHCNGSLKHACERVGVPRITHHDLRHGFAVEALRRGYDAGLDALAVLPRLARCIEHAQAQFTHYYLKLTEALRCVASDRFRQHVAAAILPATDRQEGGEP